MVYEQAKIEVLLVDEEISMLTISEEGDATDNNDNDNDSTDWFG